MTVCFIAIGVAALLAAALSAYIITSTGKQYEARLGERSAELTRAYARIEHLELTIDEIRARDLSTSLPAVPSLGAQRIPLPDEITAELAQIDDPDHRAELEEKARYEFERDPDADPAAIARELFS